jgi:hypothetical protein
MVGTGGKKTINRTPGYNCSFFTTKSDVPI